MATKVVKNSEKRTFLEIYFFFSVGISPTGIGKKPPNVNNKCRTFAPSKQKTTQNELKNKKKYYYEKDVYYRRSHIRHNRY
jgi:hypothetical protein